MSLYNISHLPFSVVGSPSNYITQRNYRELTKDLLEDLRLSQSFGKLEIYSIFGFGAFGTTCQKLF